jgi:iron complex outermembrane receptor protein
MAHRLLASNVRHTRILWASLAAAVTSIAQAMATPPTTPTNITIEPQSLATALQAFSEQSGLQVGFESQLAKGIQTPGAKGIQTPEQVLSRLLKGTGLEYRFINEQTVVIREKALKPTSAAVGRPDTFRLAQADTVQRHGSESPSEDSSVEREKSDSSHQDVKNPGVQLEEITVTGTRVAREGFTAPTPTTVLGKEDLELVGRTNIGDMINDLPQATASETPVARPASVGFVGTNGVDLRGFGGARTLVLIDGRRPVSTNVGSFDLNQIPTLLVQRLEVVTGGASAAWGSDAVSGVVNVILDNSLKGLRVESQYGARTAGGGADYKESLAFGSAFGERDRGHLIVGGEYASSDKIGPQTVNPAYQYGLIANPAARLNPSLPQQLLVYDPKFSILSQGGLILTGPPGFAGTNFGPGGVTSPFIYGQNRSIPFMSGGDPSSVKFADFVPLRPPEERTNLYGRLGYDVSENLTLKADVFFAHSRTSADEFLQLFPGPSITIHSDNAFLPQSIKNEMAMLGLSSFRMGRANGDLGPNHVLLDNTTLQTFAGAAGKLPGKWSWDAYYSYGQTHVDNALSNQIMQAPFFDSIDAVINPATGQPVCRSALTNPNSVCVPVNLFGPQPASATAAARLYFEGTAEAKSLLDQHEVAVTLHGEPFSIWAGPVSLAVGGEWRRQTVLGTADALSLAGRFVGNALGFSNLAGALSVKEGFLETVVPLISQMPLVKSFDFDGAVRLSDYSNVGSLISWKLGISWAVTDDVRLRATESQDIRAPNAAELFSQQDKAVADVQEGNNQYHIFQFVGGNPNLGAEKGRTGTYGAIYRPHQVPGLGLSVDWYLITIRNEITSLPAQAIVTSCDEGNSASCALITRDATGAIVSINATNVNLAKAQSSGLDIEGDYDLNLGAAGLLRSRALATYVRTSILYDGITTTDNAGVVGTFPIPHWRGSLSETYSLDRVSLNLRARYIGGGVRSNTVTNNANDIASQTYVDLGFQYAAGSSRDVMLYGNLINAFDRAAPLDPNAALYDVLGRTFNVGVRVRF